MWHSKEERPEKPTWYFTWSKDYPGYMVPRCFDDTEPEGRNWFILQSSPEMENDYDFYPANDNPLPCLVVNMSFDMWCEQPDPPKQYNSALKDE